MIHRMFLISSGLKETEGQRRKYFFAKNPNKYTHFFFFFDPNHKTARKSQHKGILKTNKFDKT